MTIATQATLAALLAKTLTAPATEAKQDTGLASLASIASNTAGLATSAGQSTTATGLATLHTDLTGTLTAKAAGTTVAGTLGALNATLDGTTDLTGYASVSVQVSGTFSGNISYQVSNDGTNWAAKVLVNSSSGNGSNTGSPVLASGPTGARYFRLLMGTYTSGTATGIIRYNAAADSTVGQQISLNSGTAVIGGVNVGTASTPSAFSTQAAATTNATSVKTSAGTLFEVSISNPTAGDAYFKLYNKASAPTVGSDPPVYMVKVATGATVNAVFGVNGKRFTTGIAWALTAAASSGDTTVVANAGVLVHGTYA